MSRPGSVVADGFVWSLLTAFSIVPKRHTAGSKAGTTVIGRGLSLLLAGLCLLMLMLGARPAQAVDSTICLPPDRNITVVSGGTYKIDLSDCSFFGLTDNKPTPGHGTITGLDFNSDGIAFYTNNGDSSTTDFLPCRMKPPTTSASTSPSRLQAHQSPCCRPVCQRL